MNVLLIFADQMHKYALGKVSDFVYTPNLDKLCDEGVLFNNAYSNNPVCGPFRGNLFTGMYSSHSGVINNEDPLPSTITTMAEAFNKGGFNTSFVGKWHLGATGNKPIPVEFRGGFEKFIGYQCYNGFTENVSFYDEENVEHKFNEHRTKVETDLAIDRLKELHAEGKPFLSVVAYQAPHYPVQPSYEFEKLYEEKTFSYTEDYLEIDPFTETYSPKSPMPFDLDPDYKRYGNNMQEYLRLYYAMVSEVDAGIGRILNTLEELGIRDETAIIFTADHGDMQGSHGYKNKCLPYEKSCGIPMIISVPNGRKNTVSSTLISGIDLYPTMLSLAKLPSQGHLEGRSLADYLIDGSEPKEQKIFAESLSGKHLWKMVREGDFKLTVDWNTKEPTLLFNLQEDPYEMNNLVADKKYKALVERLTDMVINL